MLVLIVGCCGLLSNILGLFLFHDHGHSHGGHSHGAHDEHSAAEEGHVHDMDAEDHAIADERGNVADVLPQNRIGNWPTSTLNGKNKQRSPRETDLSWDINKSPRRSASGRRMIRHNRSRSRGYSAIDDIYVHPAWNRNSIIESSRVEPSDSDGSDADNDADNEDMEETPTEQSPLLQKVAVADRVAPPKDNAAHKGHKHNQPKGDGKSGGGGHGHSHGDLNMRGVFLHVLGDALGNVGVIASALFIWLTDFPWRFYSDPLISLIITVIILLSAIPLCTAASRILLQAVPAGLSIDDIRDDITELDGIISCHHVHVWQLSDTKLIASLHVQVDFDFKGEGSARYMGLAQEIRLCLHEYGIHSSTIQPEFCLDATHDHSAVGTDESGAEEEHVGSHNGSVRNSKDGSVRGGSDSCLLECGDACGDSKQCCNPGAKGCANNTR
jgi:zinc transporter 1